MWDSLRYARCKIDGQSAPRIALARRSSSTPSPLPRIRQNYSQFSRLLQGPFTMTDERAKAIEVFYSYAHEDEVLLNKLKSHLSILRREGLITEWYDRQIVAGTEWEHVLDDHINTASIILLLISPYFIASDYCYGVEMVQAMQRHKASDACVIPIILRPTDWTRAPFAELQALPTNTKPLTTWSNRDEAFVDIVNGVRRAIENFHASPLHQDITRFPNKSIRYFMSLKQCLHPSPPIFPPDPHLTINLTY